MPVCPKCQTSYEEGQQYCPRCGSELRSPKGQSARCSRCGSPIAAGQDFCPDCGAAAKPEAPTGAEPPPEPPAGAKHFQRWGVAIVGGAAVVAGIVLVLFWHWRPGAPPERAPHEQKYSRGVSPMQTKPVPPQTETLPPTVAALPPISPPGGAATFQAQVETVLDNLRKANLNEDLVLYMSCFSDTFPELEKKRQDIQQVWKNHDFRQMSFTIDQLQSQGDNGAVAEVSWRIQSHNRQTQTLERKTYAYRVWFAHELGQWKIKDLKLLQP